MVYLKLIYIYVLSFDFRFAYRNTQVSLSGCSEDSAKLNALQICYFIILNYLFVFVLHRLKECLCYAGHAYTPKHAYTQKHTYTHAYLSCGGQGGHQLQNLSSILALVKFKNICKATDTDYNSNYLKTMFKTAAHKRIAFSKSRVQTNSDTK